jgi:hypothetical protein
VGDYAASIGPLGIDTPIPSSVGPAQEPNGAFQALVGVRFTEITDGLTNTLMVGEKHLPTDLATKYPWDCGLYDGHNPICNTRAAGPNFPLAVIANDPSLKFGSAHKGVVQFVFCDGAVHALRRSIDPVTLGYLAQRNDGQPIADY